ncbi:MAG: hypothetical protein K5990_04345 [Oscillospiraceae bacterium]|nr:hypothetical protein [Oscillospiraceae bacterium]
MKDIEGYDKLASLSFRMDCGIGLPDVIYECKRRGQFDTDMFAPAVYAALECFKQPETIERRSAGSGVGTEGSGGSACPATRTVTGCAVREKKSAARPFFTKLDVDFPAHLSYYVSCNQDRDIPFRIRKRRATQ